MHPDMRSKVAWRARVPVHVALAVGLVACSKSQRHEGPMRVAAAADLAFAFAELAKSFESERHVPVVLSFGSTGQLAKQISEGAPFDVFAAANVSFVDQVIGAGVCDRATKRLYGRGRIGIWTRGDERVASLESLRDERFRKVAIANPEHAPYGRAAKEALTQAGLWNALAPKMVYGENVQQTLKFAQSGNADAAIVAASLGERALEGAFTPVDEALHRPLDQALVVCGSGPGREAARAFADHVTSPAGQAVMKKYGFGLPNEAVR